MRYNHDIPGSMHCNIATYHTSVIDFASIRKRQQRCVNDDIVTYRACVICQVYVKDSIATYRTCVISQLYVNDDIAAYRACVICQVYINDNLATYRARVIRQIYLKL